MEAVLLALMQEQVRLLLKKETEHENENLLDVLKKQIQACQTAISQCKAKQTNAFEDYVEGRIIRQEYLMCKQVVADQQEEMTARYK